MKSPNFPSCHSRRHGHSHGGPSIPGLVINTIQNKYLWRCLDSAINPLYLSECNKGPSQIKFHIELLHQSYPGCAKPFKIYGAGGTDSFTIHPNERPKDCLSAPFKEGDPVFVVDCLVKDDIQTLGISWELLNTIVIVPETDDD
ncbi:375_t:CDS:2 [Funneliformis caledonium]|uniref:375_t:CDS:1 n=1 Tax=Funneliformis caledonium TaxID=1117310 RepID=A0A9N9DPE1_9GLOM|nr:375_t:CDS:2 [Funneliformis caledonium]